MRKLLPALYRRFAEGQITSDSRIVGTARSPLDDETYRERARKALGEHVRADELIDATVNRFLRLVHYVSLNGAESTGNWDGLKDLLESNAAEGRVRVFYLATAPDLYGEIARNVSEKGLRSETSRIVLEKPIGTDLDTARKVNENVGRYFPEDAVFREHPAGGVCQVNGTLHPVAETEFLGEAHGGIANRELATFVLQLFHHGGVEMFRHLGSHALHYIRTTDIDAWFLGCAGSFAHGDGRTIVGRKRRDQFILHARRIWKTAVRERGKAPARCRTWKQDTTARVPGDR